MKWDNWESPIQIIQKQIELQKEEQIMKAIQEVGVVVDKEELVRCMQYDRDQYSKGYEQGGADAIDECIGVLHNNYEVRNAEQNVFMDMLVMEFLRLKEKK